MTAKKPLDFELPPELIQQYKETFAALSDDRLLVLLLFNSFEEIIRSFAAWRLTCPVDELPFKNNTSLLIEVILAGTTTKVLRRRIEEFSALRNTVAHKFHLNDYEQKLTDFVKSNSNKLCLITESEKRKALTEAFFNLTLNIADHIKEIQPRGEWPFPLLSLELIA
jgi:hypothetical protein